MLAAEDETYLTRRLDEVTERATYALLESRLVISIFDKHREIFDPNRIHALVDAQITSLSEEERIRLFG